MRQVKRANQVLNQVARNKHILNALILLEDYFHRVLNILFALVSTNSLLLRFLQNLIGTLFLRILNI